MSSPPRPVQFMLFWDESSAPAARGEELADLPFSQAAELWLETRVKIKPRTRHDYTQYIRALHTFFGKVPLREISAADLREYQKRRAERRAEIRGKRVRSLGAGATKINQELGCLAQILQRARLWQQIGEQYEALPVPYSQAPRAMTAAEQDELLRTAASKPEWRQVYMIALLSLHTTLTGHELRGLQLGDVDIAGRMLYIRAASAKRPGRVRTIPLIGPACYAAECLVERARSLGATEPHHHLFPFRISTASGGTYDPLRPASPSWIKKNWYELRSAAGLPWLRVHDLRVSAITRLAESGASDQTVMSIAGHVSKSQLEHYSRIRTDTKREALEAASGRNYLSHLLASSRVRPRSERVFKVAPFDFDFWSPPWFWRSPFSLISWSNSPPRRSR